MINQSHFCWTDFAIFEVLGSQIYYPEVWATFANSQSLLALTTNLLTHGLGISTNLSKSEPGYP